jgi:prepilin-type N-terminal cleavage/methylation domain-containing protein
VKRSGFTLLEVAIVLIIVGLVMAFTLPRIHTALEKTNVRSARVGFGSLAARARAVAVQRGCVSTLNFSTGSAGKVWVTACKVSGVGAVDTVGTIEPLAVRYGVTVSSSQSTVQYDPRGLTVGYQAATVVFTANSSGTKDSAMINKYGKVVR